MQTCDRPEPSCKELLEWIGILSKPILGTLTVFGFLKWRNCREITKKEVDTDKGIVTVKVKGDNNSVQVTNNVLHLSENVNALKAIRDAFNPIGKDGFDNVKVRLGTEVMSTIDRPAIEAIIESATVGITEQSVEEPPPDSSPKDAWLSVYSPVFDEDAAQWRFKLGTDVIYADITDTTIATDALARGGASPNDAYNVQLEITEPTGKGKPHFKIVNVLRFVPAAPSDGRQASLDFEVPNKGMKPGPRGKSVKAITVKRARKKA